MSHGHKRHHSRRRSHRKRLVLTTIAGGIAVLFLFTGISGYCLYRSSMEVKADASEIISALDRWKDDVLSGERERPQETASEIAAKARILKSQTDGWEWSLAGFLPLYGKDFASVRGLAVTIDDLASDALVPLSEKLSEVSLNDVLKDKTLDIDEIQGAVDALADIEPAVGKAMDDLDSCESERIEQVKVPLAKAKETLRELSSLCEFAKTVSPSLSNMLGRDNGPKTYLIVAQNNSEIRSTGGFLGSVGALETDDGHIELGDFGSIYDIYPSQEDAAPLTDEEIGIFGPHVSYQIADANFIPDFSRVGEIVSHAWQSADRGTIDGVIGVDPVFLQHVLELVGSVKTSNGTVLDGNNTAKILLHDAYFIQTNKEQDAFFEEVAALSFGQLMSHLGDIPLPKLKDILENDIAERRIQVWMKDPEAQDAVRLAGADGGLSHDTEHPLLGVYFIDESYSKLFWYLDVDISVDDGIEHPDGSVIYPVTVRYRNMIDDEDELPRYSWPRNVLARSHGDMMCWLMLSAPAGGKISGIKLVEGEFVPEGTCWRDDGAYVSGEMSQASLQELDFWYGFTRTQPGESFSISFYVTCPAEAEQPLRVFHTPTAQEVAGW